MPLAAFYELCIQENILAHAETISNVLINQFLQQ